MSEEHIADVSKKDTISRQAAIDALMELVEARREWKSDASGEIKGLNAAYCAIEDLPSVPQNLQPTCNQLATDCISRQAAIDALCKACEGSGGLCAVFQCVDVRAIRNVPAIQPRRGRWETVEGWDGDEDYRCSECGAIFTLIDGAPKDNEYFFCPSCGADMRGGENEQN